MIKIKKFGLPSYFTLKHYLYFILRLISNPFMDPILFETFFKNMQPRLFAYCCKYIDDKETARDLVQECFISFWEKKQEVIVSAESYLFASVRNRALSYIRSQKIRSDYHESLKLRIKEFEFHPEGSNPVVDLYMKEMKQMLKEALSTLPSRSHQIFIMSRYEGMKNQAIADELGISIRTVESHLYQSLRHLKKQLKDFFPIIMFLIG